MIKRKAHYVDNKKFYETIVEYKKCLKHAKTEGVDRPRIPEYAGECILKIAENLATKPCFINYSYKEEMISDGIENSITYFNDYDPKKGKNPFAYFTQVIYYAFLRRINKEEKSRYTALNNLMQNVVPNFHAGHNIISDEQNPLLNRDIFDSINTFLNRFENKERVKKSKRLAKKKVLKRKKNHGKSSRTAIPATAHH